MPPADNASDGGIFQWRQNARRFGDFDIKTENFEVRLFDGRNWEAAKAAPTERTRDQEPTPR